MNTSQCNHIRIRDDNIYGINAEQFIKEVEKKFNIDFRSLPQWKELIQRLHVSTTDCKRKIQHANIRKLSIINRLYTQFTRPSPFELTEKLARTHEKWQELSRQKTRKFKLQFDTDFTTTMKSDVLQNEISETTLTIHPNTEIVEDEVVITDIALKSDAVSNSKLTEPLSHLPVNICLNQHKYLSPLNSRDFILEPPKASYNKMTSAPDMHTKENMIRNNTSLSSTPKEIYITRETLEEQILKFSVVNRTLEYMHIRFLRITDKTPFKNFKIIPLTPQKLYPGLAVTFKLIFKLNTYADNFTSDLYFKIGKNVLDGALVETFVIPIVSQFKKHRISVTETVYIPPVYLWQIRQDSGFPSAIVQISIMDNYFYHVHIAKRAVDITHEFQDSFISLEAISVSTESFNERIEDADIVTQSKTLTSHIEAYNEEIVTTLDIIELVLEDILDLALDTFVLNHTYLYLHPKSKNKICLSFTKPVCTGNHHCYYDFNFYDAMSDEHVLTKTIKVFADVLPHPIKIYPMILDMSLSPVVHGFCEDKIIITNTHKIYPVTIKIKLTTKMRKLFHISPMQRFIPATSRAEFDVKLCTKEAYCSHLEDLAYFIIKIIVIGDKSVYKNVPPIFYELIAPCASLFKKVYNDKYFLDGVEPKD